MGESGPAWGREWDWDVAVGPHQKPSLWATWPLFGPYTFLGSVPVILQAQIRGTRRALVQGTFRLCISWSFGAFISFNIKY